MTHMRKLGEIEREAARLRQVLRDIKYIAEGHHEGQPTHVLLHSLTIDIPGMVDVALAQHREEE